MPRIEHNVTISLDLWNRIKKALEDASLCDHDDVMPLLTEIYNLEHDEETENKQFALAVEGSDEEEDEEDTRPVAPTRTARRRAAGRPLDGENFFSNGEYGTITVIPNPPGRKGLDKYYESVNDQVHERLKWSDRRDAWIVAASVAERIKRKA